MGSLGAHAPRDDSVGDVAPSLHFLSLRAKRGGPSALACLGMTFQSAVPNDAMRDAVPNEVRDASLMLGRTK
jgi:hypothetical protein